MSSISCPACGHDFDPSSAPSTDPAPGAPDPSVVRWFQVDPGWTGEASTDEVYRSYLRATEQAPVSRGRFVADLAHLGVEQVLDDDTHLLVRD